MFSLAHNNVAFNRRLIGGAFMYPPQASGTGTASGGGLVLDSSGNFKKGAAEAAREEVMAESKESKGDGDDKDKDKLSTSDVVDVEIEEDFDRYTDVVAGWLLKVVCDHVGIGVKSGAPYVRRALPSSAGASNKENDNKGNKEGKGAGDRKGGRVGDREEGFKVRMKEAIRGNGTFLWAPDSPSTSLLSFLSTVQLQYGDTGGNVNKQRGCGGNFFSPEFGELNMAIECAFHVLSLDIEEKLLPGLVQGLMQGQGGAVAAGQKHPLQRLSLAMRDWGRLWQKRNTFVPTLHPVATYASAGPRDKRKARSESGKEKETFKEKEMEGGKEIENKDSKERKESKESKESLKSTCAVITIVRDEAELLPLWMRYYSRHVPLEDMYVLDHLTTDNSTHPSKLPDEINYKVLYGNSFAMPVVFRSWQINKYQDRLLRFGYKCVIFSDTDEIIVPDPLKYPGGLKEYVNMWGGVNLYV